MAVSGSKLLLSSPETYNVSEVEVKVWLGLVYTNWFRTKAYSVAVLHPLVRGIIVTQFGKSHKTIIWYIQRHLPPRKKDVSNRLNIGDVCCFLSFVTMTTNPINLSAGERENSAISDQISHSTSEQKFIQHGEIWSAVRESKYWRINFIQIIYCCSPPLWSGRLHARLSRSGPGFDPRWDKFPGRVFFGVFPHLRQMSWSFRTSRTPNIIWSSY